MVFINKWYYRKGFYILSISIQCVLDIRHQVDMFIANLCNQKKCVTGTYIIMVRQNTYFTWMDE